MASETKKTSWQEAARDQGLEISDEFYEQIIGVHYKVGFHTLFKMLQAKGILCALVTSSHRPEVSS
ncbi:hypothetical protein [Vibrio sp. VB16]|uniref:hypothetical protein n=1 Tax=Vibrio sp. VB16 TaxID=2785746 RepID=UPI0018A032B3|nr:hypothetical protein [Vibrio sp. VB16]UGA56978.1 hypothetical protein IUZ65_022590 [Vibrio sp. VB16]